MGVQIVMDRSGDTRHEFDGADAKAVALAERRFKELTGKGFRAVALAKDGGPGQISVDSTRRRSRRSSFRSCRAANRSVSCRC